MSVSLQVRWVKQLDAARLDPSWKARIEAKVLRFLLARYNGEEEATQLAPFPFYENQSVQGRTRLLLSPRDQHSRLKHIASIGEERQTDRLGTLERGLQSQAWVDLRRRRSYEEMQQREAPESLISSQWLRRDALQYGMTVLACMKRLRPEKKTSLNEFIDSSVGSFGEPP